MNRRACGPHLLLAISGFAGLGYEVVWMRRLTPGLGHEMPALLAVVAAFFLGLSLGSRWLDAPIRSSGAPGRWYAGLELGIGLWALALLPIIPWINGILLRGTGPEPGLLRQWAVALVGLRQLRPSRPPPQLLRLVGLTRGGRQQVQGCPGRGLAEFKISGQRLGPACLQHLRNTIVTSGHLTPCRNEIVTYPSLL